MPWRNLKQICTYWAPSDKSKTDINGKPASVAPVQLKCRWEDRNEQLQSKKGEQFISKSRVFLNEEVDIDGYIFLGVSAETDPINVPDALEIQQVGRQPDLRNIKNLTVLYL